MCNACASGQPGSTGSSSGRRRVHGLARLPGLHRCPWRRPDRRCSSWHGTGACRRAGSCTREGLWRVAWCLWRCFQELRRFRVCVASCRMIGARWLHARRPACVASPAPRSAAARHACGCAPPVAQSTCFRTVPVQAAVHVCVMLQLLRAGQRGGRRKRGAGRGGKQVLCVANRCLGSGLGTKRSAGEPRAQEV